MNGKKPRILLVQPTTVHLDGTPHKTRWRLIMGLMIPLMAGLTPDDYDVTQMRTSVLATTGFPCAMHANPK